MQTEKTAELVMKPRGEALFADILRRESSALSCPDFLRLAAMYSFTGHLGLASSTCDSRAAFPPEDIAVCLSPSLQSNAYGAANPCASAVISSG
jgi:hypothetical protein